MHSCGQGGVQAKLLPKGHFAQEWNPFLSSVCAITTETVVKLNRCRGCLWTTSPLHAAGTCTFYILTLAGNAIGEPDVAAFLKIVSAGIPTGPDACFARPGLRTRFKEVEITLWHYLVG
jgi:hypothetical protein